MNKLDKLINITNAIFNPAILWCHGWKRKKEYFPSGSFYRTIWRDPKTKYWWTPSVAIKICERRIAERDNKSIHHIKW